MIKFSTAAFTVSAVAAAMLAVPANAAGTAGRKANDTNTIAVDNKTLADPNRKICVAPPATTGTILTLKVCHTKAEWENTGVNVVAK